jgi:hypothetical protein
MHPNRNDQKKEWCDEVARPSDSIFTTAPQKDKTPILKTKVLLGASIKSKNQKRNIPFP